MMTTMTTNLDDLKTNVYNAAKDGIVNQLRSLLELREEGEVAEIVSAKIHGATPLMIACLRGHIEVVEYLINECAANMEQVGCFIYHILRDPPDSRYPYPTGDVTPLWCAAVQNHMDIVTLLTTKGADVNHAAPSNSTPLMAACKYWNFPLVQFLVDNKADINIADEQGMTCLMLSCREGEFQMVKYLIEKGADVHRKDLDGATALHYCIEFCHTKATAATIIEIMKLLLECKARVEKNSEGMTPLLLAAAHGEAVIVNFLISINEIERAEKIDALELLGATCVARNNMTDALTYWRWAMDERFRDGYDVIQKPMNQEPNVAYENAVEVNTLDELDDLISDPDAIQMQALVVRERILGLSHSDTITYILGCGKGYAHRGSLDKCLSLWNYALDMQQKFFEPLHFNIEHILELFANLFACMMTQEPHNIEFDIIIHVLDTSVSELERSSNVDLGFGAWDCMLVITLSIIGLICRIQESFSKEQVYEFRKTVFEFVKLNIKDSGGYTPLHLICEGEKNSYVWDVQIITDIDFVFPSLDVAKILTEVGASVNAKDNDYGYTPLHAAAENDVPWKGDLIEFLLEKGAHIDVSDLEGKPPMGLLYPEKDCKTLSPIAMKYQTLQCLAARVIVANDISYKGIVPEILEEFVAMH